jgi:hypothetical protein
MTMANLTTLPDGSRDPVAVIAPQLRGPSALRRDLLAELADGFEDTVAAHRECGLDEAEAHAAARADFGDPDVVREACQRELTAVQARRTALVVCLALPATDQLWARWYPDLVGRSIADGRLSFVGHGPMTWLLAVQTVATWLFAAAALHQVVLLRRGRGAGASAVVAALTATAVLLVGGTSAVMMTRDGGTTLAVLTGSVQGRVLGAISAAMLLVVAGLAWRTAALTRLAVGRSRRTPRRAGT